MKLTLIKQLDNSFKLAYNSDYEKAKKIKVGEEYQCEIKRPRNYAFLKKFFALLELVYQNQDITDDKEDLRAVLIMKSGYYKTIETDKGNVYLPKSLSFAKMSQEDFDTFYSKFLDVSCQLLGVEKEDVMNEIKEFY